MQTDSARQASARPRATLPRWLQRRLLLFPLALALMASSQSDSCLAACESGTPEVSETSVTCEVSKPDPKACELANTWTCAWDAIAADCKARWRCRTEIRLSHGDVVTSDLYHTIYRYWCRDGCCSWSRGKWDSRVAQEEHFIRETGGSFSADCKDAFRKLQAQKGLELPEEVTGDAPVRPSSGEVMTLAGGGSFTTDETLATAAGFQAPHHVAVDGNGRVYVTEDGSAAIRVIHCGKVKRYAGTGLPGHLDGPVAKATFKRPTGIAIDDKGRLYVADADIHRIRLVEQGQVTTLAGIGAKGFMDGPAGSARFNTPSDVAVDSSGRVYVADTYNYAVRVIYQGQVTTLAGEGRSGVVDGPADQARFERPIGVAVDDVGRVYVVEKSTRIRMIYQGQVTTLAGGDTAGSKDGPLAAATFTSPTGVAVDGTGRVYVLDSSVRVIDQGQVSTIKAGPMLMPSGIAVDASGRIYFADSAHGWVRVIQ